MSLKVEKLELFVTLPKLPRPNNGVILISSLLIAGSSREYAGTVVLWVHLILLFFASSPASGVAGHGATVHAG